MSSLPVGYSVTAKLRTPFFLILLTAGLAGNYFKFPLFLDIDFLFGSIFAMLALQFFGVGRGILAAAIIASYTYVLWNHPYAIIIMTAEVAVVGWLMWRYKIGMVLADTLYWLIIGMPLVYLFYHLLMQVNVSIACVTMTKQAINGIANALVARLVFTFIVPRFRSTRVSLSEIIYNLLAFFVLCPVLLMLSIGSRSDFKATDHRIRTTLIQDSERLHQFLATWLRNRNLPIVALAELATSISPVEMQSFLEVAKKSNAAFLRIGLLDQEATVTAYSPPVDELGKENIGKNFADRPFIAQLKRTLKPMLSEVVMGRIGSPKPMITVLAPVIRHGEYGGYVTGILSLEQVRDYFDMYFEDKATLYTLLDKNNKVIMSNRTDRTVMHHFARDSGSLNRIDNKVSQWVPNVLPNISISERWQKSFYVGETTLGEGAEWKLILEQPVAPFQKMLSDNYTSELTLLFLCLLVGLTLAEFLSRRSIVTLDNLRLLTSDLPVRLQQNSEEIIWPDSGIEEVKSLINNFKEMTDSLVEQYNKIRTINVTLEQKVEERTEALTNTLVFDQVLMNAIPSPIFYKNAELFYIGANRAYEQFIGLSLEQIVGKNVYDISPVDLAEKYDQKDKELLDNPGVQTYETSIVYADGTRHEVIFSKATFTNVKGEVAGLIGVILDITKQLNAEKELLKVIEEMSVAKQLVEKASLAKSDFLANMSHELRTPLNSVIGFSEVLQDQLFGTINEKQQEYVNNIHTSGKHLLSLIEDILELTKVESGKMEIELSSFSLRELVEDALMAIRAKALNGRIELHMDLASEVDMQMVGDQRKLKQILLNLLSNAIKFTPAGGTVNVSAVRDGDFIEITLTDTGVGIREDDIPKIFEIFTQLELVNTKKYEGIGLGLALTRQIVEFLGGKIWVESTLGAGSKFSFTLPLAHTIHPSP